MANARSHVVIEGIVQGVFFRASARDVAHSLGLKGWVRNCYDGCVEAVFEGERIKVEKMLEWCGKGPTGAIVRNVKADWEVAIGDLDAFTIRY